MEEIFTLNYKTSRKITHTDGRNLQFQTFSLIIYRETKKKGEKMQRTHGGNEKRCNESI